MTIIDAYKCDICGKVYATKEEAKACEKECGSALKDRATVFFQDGEVVNWADFITGNSPAFEDIRAIKVADEDIAFDVQKYLYHEDCLPFPTLTKDDTIFPATMVCGKDTWSWVELEAAIGEEENRHKAAMKELESWR